MTKTETIKFLERKQRELKKEMQPHEVLKWLRIMQSYFKLLFGEDSAIYIFSIDQQQPNPSEAKHDFDQSVLIARMQWLLDDAIQLVKSGILDTKFDKNRIYNMSDGAIVGIVTFSLVTVFSIGFYFGGRTDKEIKVSFSERPFTPVITTLQNNRNIDTNQNNHQRHDSTKIH